MTEKKNPRTDTAKSPFASLPEPRPNVPIRSGDEPARRLEEGQRFGGDLVLLSRMAGASQVHVNLVVVPPRRQTCPFHYHFVEEEHFFVLDGRCVLRSGDDRHEMAAGDYVCFPAGTRVGHAIENPFDAPCRLLTIGPSATDETVVYPDSGKAKLRALDAIVPWPQDGLGYWDGEAVDEPLESS